MAVEKNIIIHSADRRRKQGFLITWILMVKHVFEKHELIKQLFIRDFFMANRRSFLGSAWLFLSPIFGMISWLFLNMAGLLNPGNMVVPYPLYLLNGTLLWGFFMSCVIYAKDTLVVTAGYIAQVNFPHEVILIKQIMQAVVNALLGFTINLVIMFAFGYPPTWWVLTLPVLILPLIMLAAGAGIIFAVIRVVFPDADRVLQQVLPLLMYTAPIIYSADVANAKIALVIKYNPLTYVIGVPRDIILQGVQGCPWFAFVLCAIASFIFFLIALRVFYVSEEIVVERIY